MDSSMAQLQPQHPIVPNSAGWASATLPSRAMEFRQTSEPRSNSQNATSSCEHRHTSLSSTGIYLSDGDITTKLLESAEYKALCEVILGSRDGHVAIRSEKYKAFCELSAHLEAEKKATTSSRPFPQLEAKRTWNSFWW